MPDEGFWKGVRRKKKLCNKLRKKSLLKKLPVLRAVCNRAGIAMTKVEHGYQFSFREYLINWSPSTNKVTIQYRIPGENRTVLFVRDGEPDKPRILVAIEELINVTRREDRINRSRHDVYASLPAEQHGLRTM